MSFPKYLLVREEEDGGETYFLVDDVEGHAGSAGGQSVAVARYKLIGSGRTQSYVDYVEDGQPQCDDEE